MKKILILLILVLLTGCSVNYELNINQDNTYDEVIYFTETNEVLSKYGESISDAVNNVKEFFLSGENDIEPEVIVNNKTTFKSNDSESITYKLKKNLDNVKDYSESLFFNYYFESSKVDSDNNMYTIYGNKFNFDNIKKLTTSYKYIFDLDTVVIKIHSDYDVIDTNATNIDREKNDYYWIVNESNASNFELKLTYSKNNVFTYDEIKEPNVIEKVVGDIIEKVSLGNVNGKEFAKENKVFLIAFIGIILVVILLVILYIRKKINQTNRI